MRKEVWLMIFKNIVTLQPKIYQDFYTNLDFLVEQIQKAPKDSLILAPEVALTGFSYQRMEEASEFSKIATQKFLDASTDKTFMTTMIEKKGRGFFNNFKVFWHNTLIHKQSKSKLFALGNEHLHFQAGDEEECVPFVIDGVKCAALICYELRFIEKWQKIQDVEIIFIPAQWGEVRKEHFVTLARALAIANQCYVVVSNPRNLQMAKNSAIITPYGIMHKNDKKPCIEVEINLEEVEHMRKHIQLRGMSV
ncbi:nitrilase-related carbon-nitrogen hydrolase [Helicobacter anatolicus]|uniref:nitrilase-related carbon-nitrogen hydrolase n=1 Tax=Helicobacter anatolicus TaxID=2905874 RepID=UPI001E2D065C|nr:nitrilase-related carbon-nitrogen hydrolase [Helicobacter anatolicus]MCE3039173.1 carbon-nitrogen hydrolase family protein [Helicobacter anatolicus]